MLTTEGIESVQGDAPRLLSTCKVSMRFDKGIKLVQRTIPMLLDECKLGDRRASLAHNRKGSEESIESAERGQFLIPPYKSGQSCGKTRVSFAAMHLGSVLHRRTQC